MDFYSLGIQVPTHRSGDGNIKIFCPKCHATRHDRHDKSLSVNLRSGLFKCHYCGYSGAADRNPAVGPVRPASTFGAQRPASVKASDRNYALPSPANCNQPVTATLGWFASRGISPNTLRMLRVSESVERMPRKEAPVPTVNFNYFLDDRLVNIKYRTPDKAFRMTTGARLIPYNIDAVRNAKECIITEGEMDALSFAECGRLDVISVPAGANANLEWLDDFIDPENYRLSTILERAGYMVRRHGIKALVIDPYNRLEPEGDDTRSETLQISAMLDRLTRFAQTNDVLVILMAHPTKLHKNKEGTIDPPSLYDISGSAHFYNKADYGLVVHRNRQLKLPRTGLPQCGLRLQN